MKRLADKVLCVLVAYALWIAVFAVALLLQRGGS